MSYVSSNRWTPGVPTIALVGDVAVGLTLFKISADGETVRRDRARARECRAGYGRAVDRRGIPRTRHPSVHRGEPRDLEEAHLDITPDGEFDEHLKCAASYADRIDPLQPLRGSHADARLLVRFADGDRSAFAPLFARVWPATFAVARRITNNEADADDAAQQAVFKIFDSIADLDPGRNAVAWAL